MMWNVLLSLGEYFYNPYIWVFLIGAPLLYFVYLWIIRLSSRTVDAQGAGPGCLIQLLGLLLQATGIAAVMLLLLPVLLGVSDKVSWQAIEPLGFVAIRSGLLAMILVTIASFFPLIGKLLGSSPGLEFYFLSWLTFRFLSPLYLEAIVGTGNPVPALFPPWWIVLLLAVLVFLLSRFLQGLVLKVERWNSAVGPSLDILAGILPFLYYARWVAQSLKGI